LKRQKPGNLFVFFTVRKGLKRGPSFNTILTSAKETLGNLFMFQESEKGLKDDSVKNNNFPLKTPCPAQKRHITHTRLKIGKNTLKNVFSR